MIINGPKFHLINNKSESNNGVDKNLRQIFLNRLAKNELKSKYKVSRQDYNRERRKFMSDYNFQQQYSAKTRPEIIPLITATIREEHQRLVKQQKNSLQAKESLNLNQKNVRLKPEELEQRIRELPMMIKGLEDLRDLWRALQNYAGDLNQNETMARLIENEKKNIVQTVYSLVPADQMNIDLFVECFKTKEAIRKWREEIGTIEKWQSFFT